MTNFPTRIPDCDHNHFKKIKATYLLLILNFWYRLFNIKKQWHPKKSLSAIKSKPDLTNDTLICVSSTKLAYNHPFTIQRFYHPSVSQRYSLLAIQLNYSIICNSQLKITCTYIQHMKKSNFFFCQKKVYINICFLLTPNQLILVIGPC